MLSRRHAVSRFIAAPLLALGLLVALILPLAAMIKEQPMPLPSGPQQTLVEALREAAGRVRFQLGQSDRFRAGLERSGAWRPHIARTHHLRSQRGKVHRHERCAA